MSERGADQSAPEVTDFRDTLREECLPSTTKQSLAELALLLGDLPTPVAVEYSPMAQLSAVAEALSEHELSQMSVALPTANRPTGTPGGEESGEAPSVIVDFSVIAVPTGRSDVPTAAGEPTRPRGVPPVVPAVPVTPPHEVSSAPVSTGNGVPGATTRQALLPVPKAPPVTPAGLGHERAAWLIILAGSQYPRGHLVPLTFGRRTRYRIGGDTSCEIVITSPVVSREHAEIGFDPSVNGFFLVDLGSTNGTYVQSPGMGLYQVSGTAALRDNSLIWLGREQVRFSFRCY